MTSSHRRRLSTATAALALLALFGCANPPRIEDFGPVREPSNVRGPASWPAEVLRVAVLPAHDSSGRLTSEFVSGYDVSWIRALSHTQRAEFVAVSRATLADWTGRESIDSTSPLPPDLLARAAAETGAQALLFLDLTQVSPYPPLSLAFRARLAGAPGGSTLWMADETFDLRDGPTARALRRAARANASGAGDAADSVAQSPSRLADQAFRAVAALLPPRAPAPPPAPSADHAKQIAPGADTKR